MIFHCLRYWVTIYHVDGFRFDLASILSRDRNGRPNPPVVDRSPKTRCSATRKSSPKLGTPPGRTGGLVRHRRWAEWNGRYRDDVRRFWRGDRMLGAMATRLAGSATCTSRAGRPYHSINFITSHDGFTLNDLVSYNASTTRTTAKKTATATTTITAPITASKASDAPSIEASACGRSRTPAPR